MESTINSNPKIRAGVENFYILELPSGVSPAQIDIEIQKLVEDKIGVTPDLIIIDHLERVSLDRLDRTGNIKDDEQKIISDFINIAKKYKSAVLLISQIRLEAIKKLNKLSKKELKKDEDGNYININNLETLTGDMIAGSRTRLENVATAFTMNISQQDEELGIMRLYVDKNRYGIDRIQIPFIFSKDPVFIKSILDTNELFKLNITDPHLINSVEKLREFIYTNPSFDTKPSTSPAGSDNKDDRVEIPNIIDVDITSPDQPANTTSTTEDFKNQEMDGNGNENENGDMSGAEDSTPNIDLIDFDDTGDLNFL